jgi:hypothetical protein
MKNTDPGNIRLSDDPVENLRMENEILRLKLKAEAGAEFQAVSDIPSEIENTFLKHVLHFEHAAAGAKQITVYDKLGRPDFIPASELSDKELKRALKRITTLMLKKQIEVDFSGSYDERTRYSFITDELFECETSDFFISGMITHYCYEEFHPDHKMDIKNRTTEFISDWLEHSFNEYSWELAPYFILPDGKVLSKEMVLEKLKSVFDCYTCFCDSEYFIENTNFELKGDINLGHSEGTIKYTAILENDERVSFEGPFKLYFSMEGEWWHIYYFVLPGFNF